MLIAVTREISPSIGQCELTYFPRIAIDLGLARSQHHQYQKALVNLGCTLITLGAEPELPDAVFVEDVAIVLDEIAIITRPGVESRRPETVSIARKLGEYRQLGLIEPPGTLEGGDVLRVGKKLHVGLSGRSNVEGIRQLRELISPHGYVVKPVEVSGCLHLKSAVTQVAPDVLLINPEWVDKGSFECVSFIEVDPGESYAGNALLVGATAIYPASFPHTCRRLVDRGIAVVTVDVSELQKAEGAVTCCSLVFEAS